jgi:Leucine-rich repeat (LRR) protein
MFNFLIQTEFYFLVPSLTEFVCVLSAELPSDVEELKNLTQFLLLLPESPTQSKDANNQNFILKMEHWTKIVNLCLCGLNMETFPESVWKMSALRTLNLSRNFLRFIPTEIGLLSNLTNVDLSLNRISHIPTEFANLYQLQVLNLSHNQLTEIPEWFTSFSCLTRLDIESNQFTSFPHHLPIGLLTLDVGWNQISSIQSNTFCLFARINCLIFYSNQITTIPTEVALLTTLKELNFERNKLSFVPSDLGRLSHLKILYLADNDLTFIPINVFRFVKEFQYHYLESLKFPRITDDDWKEFATVYHDLYQD